MSSWVPASKTKDYAKIEYDNLLMNHIELCGKQLSKLPNEIPDERFNQPMGVKYEEIEKSYINLVNHLGMLLKPYWKDDEEYKKTHKDHVETLKEAMEKFGNLIILADSKSLLLQKIAIGSADLDEDQEAALVEAPALPGT